MRNYRVLMIQCAFSLCLSGDESLFLCIDALDHSQVCKKCNRKEEQRGKSRKLRCPLSFSSVIFSSQHRQLQRKRSQVYNNRPYIHSFSRYATIPASLPTRETFLLGNTVQRWVVVAASSMFARLFSMTHELWIWCVHVSSPTMPRFSGVTRKCDEESFLSQRRPDSIRI